MAAMVRICPMRDIVEVAKNGTCNLHVAVEKWPNLIKGEISKNLGLFSQRPEDEHSEI